MTGSDISFMISYYFSPEVGSHEANVINSNGNITVKYNRITKLSTWTLVSGTKLLGKSTGTSLQIYLKKII